MAEVVSMKSAAFMQSSWNDRIPRVFAIVSCVLMFFATNHSVCAICQANNHAELERLSPLLGDWSHLNSAQTTELSCRWTNDGNFLLVDIHSQTQGSPDRTATERIAWDPAEKCFRSWAFHSDGSFGESVWSEKEKGWQARIRGVAANGEPVKGTVLWQPMSDGRLSLRSEGFKIGKENVPENELVFSRSGEAPAPMPGSGAKPAPIENIKWDMVEMNSVPMEFDRPLAIKFVDGKLEAVGVINRIGGNYSLTGNELKITKLSATRMGGPPELLQLETTFTEMLESVDSVQIDGPELLLMDGQQTVGRFRPGR
jgi:heat shock protein HslJ